MKQGGQSCAPSPSICSADPSDGAEIIDINKEPITGDLRKWDPHAGTKPSKLDDCGSDGEVELEDELPDGGDVEVNGPMVDMMVNLGEWDKHEFCGKMQKMVMETGEAKGLQQTLKEHGFDVNRMRVKCLPICPFENEKCCMAQLLSKQEDFHSQVSLLEQKIKNRGHHLCLPAQISL